MTFKKEQCSLSPQKPQGKREVWWTLTLFTLLYFGNSSPHLCLGIHICIFWSVLSDNSTPPFLCCKLDGSSKLLLSNSRIIRLVKYHPKNMPAKSVLYKYIYQIKSIINPKDKNTTLNMRYNLFRYLTTFLYSLRNLISWLNRGKPSTSM